MAIGYLNVMQSEGCVCVCVSLCMYEGLLCGMFLFWLSQSMRAQLLMP